MYFKFLFVVVVCGLIVLLEQPVKLSAQRTTSKTIDIDLSLSSSELNPDLIAPTENYPNAVVLIEPDVYLLYWRSNGTHIQFEIHAKTSGWFSFGVKSKSTSQIDFVVGYLNDDGTGHFSDRYGASLENSRVDARQDWLPIYMAKNNGYTIFSFVRSLRVCAGRNDEDVEDVDIPLSGNATVVFSTGEVFNGEFVPYEILKGQKDIELVSIDPDEDDLPPLVNCTGGGEDQESKFNPKPLVNLANKLELVKNRLVIFWNLTKNALIAEVHLNAKGWFSLGISSSKDTIKSDLLMAWIADEKAYFFDCHVNNSQVIIDKNSSYELLYATETNNNLTIFRFRREAILCDLDDKTIETGTPFLKFNWGLDKPKSLENINKLVKQTQNSGLVQIDFFSKSYLINKEQKLDYLDFTISHVVMPYDTGFFYCKAFEIPRSLAKRHFVKWEIKLPRVNLDKIRNIRLYKCHSSYRGEPSIGSGDCYANTHKLESCYEPLIIWSHGSNTVTLFPEDAGYPIGQDADYSYVVLEILYQNIDPQPKQEDDEYDDEDDASSSTPKLAYFDQLTLRLFMAEKLRAHELGVITLGTEPEPIGILIPPQFQRFQISSYCFNNCIKEKFATLNEVTVVMAFPNTNRAGREVSTSIVRNNKEVEYIHRNRHYNSNYQNYVELNPRVNITKDDTLITKCFYSTIDRSSLTVGGYVANKEMCLEHFFYYPPIKNFGYCGSFPTFDDQLNMFNELKKKGLINYNDALTRSTNNGGILINSQANNDKLATLYSAYDSLAKMSTFDPTISARLVELYNSSRFYSSCEDGNLFKAQTKPDVEKWLSEAEKSHIIPHECMTRRNASHAEKDGIIEEDASKNNLMSLGVNANLPSASVRISHWSSNILYFFSIIVTTLLVRSF